MIVHILEVINHSGKASRVSLAEFIFTSGEVCRTDAIDEDAFVSLELLS